MAPKRLLALGPALLATCTGGGAHVIGDPGGIGLINSRNKQGLRQAGRPVGVTSAAASVAAAASTAAVTTTATAATTGGEGADDGSARGESVRCGGLLARAVCVRTRGGTVVEGGGPDDYSSTLQDQSQPWWTEDKNTHLIRPVKPKKSGSGFFGLGGTAASGSNSRQRAGSSNVSPRSKAQERRGEGDLSDSRSAGGWAIFAALPVALLTRMLGGETGTSGTKPSRQAKASADRAPPKLSRPAKAVAKRAPVSKPQRQAAKTSDKRALTVPKKGVAAAAAAPVRSASTTVRRRDVAGGGGERVGSSLMRVLVPDNPYLRAVGIVVLAALGSGGLYAVTVNDFLRAAWPIPFFDPWQIMTALAWAVNMMATFGEGRLDGSSSRATSSGFQPIRFFTPASWAFMIWAPIFFGELLFVLFQLVPIPSIRGSWWLSDISPWFSGAMLFQTLWCASFRPWARDAGLLWLPALLLGGVAVALGGAHGVLREAWFAGDMELPQYFVSHLPISLHFGWISCASLVSLNGFLASVDALSSRSKLVASVCTVLAAVVLGTGVTLIREDPLYAVVVAWALWAVGSPAGWSDLKGRVDPDAIRVQEVAAKIGAVLTLSSAGFLLGLSVKDAVMGGGGGDAYDEDY